MIGLGEHAARTFFGNMYSVRYWKYTRYLFLFGDFFWSTFINISIIIISGDEQIEMKVAYCFTRSSSSDKEAKSTIERSYTYSIHMYSAIRRLHSSSETINNLVFSIELQIFF